MASKKTQGYVIARSKSRTEYYTSSAAYDRPEWVALDEATVYSTPDLAQQAAKKLWLNGSFAASVKPLTELIDMELEVPPADAAPAEEKPEMVAIKQAEEQPDGEMQGICPECDCDPCECDDAAKMDASPTDEIPTDKLAGEPGMEEPGMGEPGVEDPGMEFDSLDRLEQEEEDSLMMRHLKAAAGLESEETARLHPLEVKMFGKKRMDMKECAVGDVVLPKIGPHKGLKHRVIHVFDDGSMNIAPLDLPARQIRYRLGAAKAQPDQVEMVTESDAVRRPTDEEHKLAKAYCTKKGTKLSSIGVDKATGKINIECADGKEYVIDGVKENQQVKPTRMPPLKEETKVKLPARPGNDPAKPSENDTTAATMKDPKSTMVDFKDPVGEEDKPQTDLTYAVAHEHDEKVTVPAEIKSQLKAVIDDFAKAAKDNDLRDDTKGSFAMTAGSALQQLLDDLELGTVAGIKQAQIHMTSYMNPITTHIPEDVVKFIARGGRKSSLKDLFDIKWEKMRGVK